MNIALLFSGLVVAVLALAPCGARAAGAANTASTASKPAATPAPEAPPPRAVFVIDSQFGRDPFFPKSTRLGKAAPQTNVVVTTTSSQFPEDVRVQGVSNQRGRILVIVNGKSIEKGEKVELNLRIGRVPVRCLDITEKTILLEFNGITKELNLPVGIPATPE